MQLWDPAWLNFFVPDSSSESLQTVPRQNWRLLGSGMGTKILSGLKLSRSLNKNSVTLINFYQLPIAEWSCMGRLWLSLDLWFCGWEQELWQPTNLRAFKNLAYFRTSW